jgi:hypothetical protein
MKKFIKSKKGIALLATLVVAAVTAVGAFAYFTSAGSGSGSATVGSPSASDIQLSSATVGDLYPGGADVPVTVDISNTGNGTEYVGTISGTVEDNGDCLGSWFQVDSVDYNKSLDKAGNDSANTNVRMLNKDVKQDACEGQTMTIDWTSN